MANDSPRSILGLYDKIVGGVMVGILSFIGYATWQNSKTLVNIETRLHAVEVSPNIDKLNERLDTNTNLLQVLRERIAKLEVIGGATSEREQGEERESRRKVLRNWTDYRNGAADEQSSEK